MYKGNLTREQVIKMVGLELVVKVESIDCDFTNRLMPGGFEDIVEFAASVDFIDDEEMPRTLTAYYYQDQDDLNNLVDGDLGVLNWEINGYEIW